MGEVKTHGRSGYKRGCRCFICRRAHADEQNEYNEKQRRKADRTLSVKPGAEPGAVEKSVVARINDLKLRGTEAEMLTALAHATARGIDAIIRDQRTHLLASAQRNLLEAMDRLAGLGKAPASAAGGTEVEDDFLGSLGTPEP